MAEIKVGPIPFKEAQEYIKQKLNVPTERWNDLAGPAHAKAFTVAGATKIALLKDLHQAVRNAIDNGLSIAKFRKEFDAIVAKHGWSYNGKRGWRTSVIFRTNKRTAYMAGHWEQAWRLRAERPYLQYLTVGDERVRESHQLHDRKVFKIDHPFWKTHYPPNGWLCRCTVRTLSADEVKDQGLKISDEKPQPIEYTDPVTGEITKGHKGIDIGWDYNVGRSWQAPEVLLGQEIMSLPAQLRVSALNMLKTDVYDKPFEALLNDVSRAILTNQTAIIGRNQTVGFIAESINEFLSQNGKVLIGSTLTVRDKDIYHWLRPSKSSTTRAIPLSAAVELSKIIRQPDAVLFDSNDESLIFVRHLGQGRYAKFIVHINFKGKLTKSKIRFNDHLNIVKSAGLTSGINLIGPELELIIGKIETE